MERVALTDDELLIRYARKFYGERFAETVAFALVRGGGFAAHVRGSLFREIARHPARLHRLETQSGG